MANLSKEIVQFAAGDTTFFEAFQDYFYHKESVEKGKNFGYFDASHSLDEKREKVNKAFLAEVEKRSGVARNSFNADSWAVNPNVIWGAFAVIDATINSVLPEYVTPSLGAFVDMRYVGYGDAVHFTIKPRSLVTVSRGGFGERTSFRQRQHDGDLLITPVEHIVTVWANMMDVLAGRADIANLVRIAIIALENNMQEEAFKALTSGMAAGTYPAALSVEGAYDANTLIKLAETVEAYNYGERPIVMGTATALAKVLPDSAAGFRGNYDADGGKVNLLKTFYDFDILRLRQFATGVNYGLGLDPDTLYIVSPAADKLVKGVLSTQLTNSNQFYDNADISQNFTIRKAYELAFASAAIGAKYKITD